MLSDCKLSKIEIIIDKIRLKSKAHQKLLTENPGKITSANRMINALITKRKSPNDKIVIGIVRITSIGLIVAFNSASKATNRIAFKKLSTDTPGKI